MDTEILSITTDFSLWALFIRADIVVKLVMVGLIAASIWSWAIIAEKYFLFRHIATAAEEFEQLLWSGQAIDNIQKAVAHLPPHPLANVLSLTIGQWHKRDKRTKSLPPVVERTLYAAIADEMHILEKRMVFLATTGAVAPFVGLFGTVWGIMNSFQAIASTRDTNLAVVAPGIAEALFATGLGLLAAIPAVVAYNVYVARLNNYNEKMNGFAEDFLILITQEK
ncbi:MAG: protein TolQ [Alphaproteobacteria bacterium]|nr:protein TolQ [Alphaproteobacteria bacterium]MBE8220022.1 protein TolQ [Alphaproteobacteria bacterium]